ncbi:MAG: hypothetical protein IIW15_04545 [Firmicutes bacterium]|nr:hypothetical protein [Bacillota bacterium]
MMDKLPYLTVLGADVSEKLKEINDRYPNMTAGEILRKCVISRWKVMKKNEEKEANGKK